MQKVKPKKFLGQHFLRDQQVAWDIVNTFNEAKTVNQVLEIGPGTGVLTEKIREKKEEDLHFKVIELDRESVAFLRNEMKLPEEMIIEGDFLQLPLEEIFDGQQFSIIGNFPYNISSQIFFKVLDHIDLVQEVTGMLQKEVAERIASKPGKKTNGILTILLQAFYDITYDFTVPPEVFNPPPKVHSGVITMKRNDVKELEVPFKLFKQVVKQGFNNRRKTLRNALKGMGIPEDKKDLDVFNKRAEQLGVPEFIELTKIFQIEREKQKLEREKAAKEEDKKEG